MEEVEEREEIIERVAALDVGKASLVCCVRVPGVRQRRAQETRMFATTTRQLEEMADWLAGWGVTRVVMEATSDYWRAPFYTLEDREFDVWLVNARDVKHLPGRPKTDRIDAQWLCKLAERQMLQPCFVPPEEIRQLRDLTRYRSDLVAARTAEKQRVEKLLEDAQIKLSVVASDIFGVSGRHMMAALIDGQRDGRELAELAKAALRGKRPQLVEALTGRFNTHHAFLLTRMLARVDALTADIAAVEEELDRQLVPFAAKVTQLDAIPGVGATAAAVILAEVGHDMSHFPTAAQLTSWAKFAPVVQSSAGRRTGKSVTGKGNPYLAAVIGEAAVGASKTDTFLGHRYRRIAARRGARRAVVAVGRSILVIIWHLLSDPDAVYTDLGAHYYNKRYNPKPNNPTTPADSNPAA